MLAQEGAAVVQRAPVPRRRVRSLDVGDDARTAVGAGERLRVLGAEQGVARGAEEVSRIGWFLWDLFL